MNSTTKIIAGVAVLALLFAAVGYATYTGTAKTYNEDNEVKSEFATIAFDSWTPFTGATAQIDFDSYSYEGASATETVYKPKLATGTTLADLKIDEQTMKGYELGSKTLTLTNNTAEAIATFDLEVGVKAAITGAEFKYYLEVTDGKENGYYDIKPLTATPFTFNVDKQNVAVGEDATYTVTLYLVYLPNMYVPTNEVGPATPTAPEGQTVAEWVVSTPEAVAEVKIDAGYYFKFTATNFAAAASTGDEPGNEPGNP